MALFQSIIEIFKVYLLKDKFLHGLSPPIMGDIIKLNRPSTYNVRTRQELYNRSTKTVRYGTETISFFRSESLGSSSTKYEKLHLSFII